jgi:hypothetical protein
MKTLSETELAQVIEALGVACGRISHTVADDGGSGAELDPRSRRSRRHPKRTTAITCKPFAIFA